MMDRMKKSVNYENARVVNKISNGQFGGIYLLKEEDKYYCLKKFEKTLLEEYEVSKFIQNEPKLSLNINSYFISPLYKAIQTKNSAYYISEYV